MILTLVHMIIYTQVRMILIRAKRIKFGAHYLVINNNNNNNNNNNTNNNNTKNKPSPF